MSSDGSPASTPPSTSTASDRPAPEPGKKSKPKRYRWWVLLACGLLLTLDLALPPRYQVSSRVLIGGIHLYQDHLSPTLARAGVSCRFKPTCSRYSEAVLRRYGTLGGLRRTLVRIGRCGPWTPAGTEDLP